MRDSAGSGGGRCRPASPYRTVQTTCFAILLQKTSLQTGCNVLAWGCAGVGPASKGGGESGFGASQEAVPGRRDGC